MKAFLLSLAAAAVLATAARADNVTLTTNAPTGTPLTVNPGAVSGPMLFRVQNVAPLTSMMKAWQMNLMIAPIGGVTGTVTFATPASGTYAPGVNEPPSYFLAGNNAGLQSLILNGGTTLRVDDFATTAVAIPVGPSNLLQVTYQASALAGGTWGVYAVQGPGNTLFTNGSNTDQYFTNVPMTGGTPPFLIGEIFVPVPEPTGLIAIAAMVGYVGSRLRRRFRRTPEAHIPSA